MSTEHRYLLDPGSKKHPCPACGQKRFVRYVDTHAGEHLPEQYGRCDREINCAYHLNPYNDDYAKMVWEQEHGHRGNGHRGNGNCSEIPNSHKPVTPKKKSKPVPKPISFIPVEKFKESRKGYGQNNFVHWLTSQFGNETTTELISRYNIGTSKHWEGATVFWQIDTKGRVRSGKIMLYNPTTGKRVKEPFNHITWVHKALQMPNFSLKQCLFGEHLLKGNNKPVALVESEKTAIIANVYLPKFIWLAVGSLSNLNAEKCQALKGRDVYLFPDLNAFEKWNTKAKELTQQIPSTRFITSCLLEKNASATDKAKGLDIADYLVKQDYKEYSNSVGQSRSTCKQSSNENLKKPEIQKGNNLAKLNIEKAKNLRKPQIQSQIKPETENRHKSEEVENEQGSQNLTKPNIQTRISEPKKARAEKPESWTVTINGLETFFAGATLPDVPIKLNEYTTVTDVSKFIHSHINTVKANNGKQTFLPYLNRLQELKNLCMKEN